MSPHLLTNFKIEKYYQKEPEVGSVYSRNILPKIKDEAYIINLHEYESIRIVWIALYVNDNNVTYEFLSWTYSKRNLNIKLIEYKNIIANIYRIQEHD